LQAFTLLEEKKHRASSIAFIRNSCSADKASKNGRHAVFSEKSGSFFVTLGLEAISSIAA